jgi:hypothetical protein
MTRFEELPGNVRTLMLARLAMEMRQLNAIDLRHLAMLRRVSMAELWRGICRKVQQPVCSLPLGATPAIERRHAPPPARPTIRLKGLAP